MNLVRLLIMLVLIQGLPVFAAQKMQRQLPFGVMKVAWRADSSLVAVARGDVIRLWAPKKRQWGATLSVEGMVLSLAWNSTGTLLAAGTSENAVELWGMPVAKKLAQLKKHQDWVVALVFSPDGRTFASGSEDGTVVLWDADTQKARATLQGSGGYPRNIAFSPDGRDLIIARSTPAVLEVWNPVAAGLSHTLAEQYDGSGLAFSPDGRNLAVGRNDYSVDIWDLKERKIVSTWYSKRKPNPEGRISPFINLRTKSLAWNPEGTRVAGALDAVDYTGAWSRPLGRQSVITLWKALDGAAILELSGHDGWVTDLAWSPNGEWFASASTDGSVRLWDGRTGRQKHNFKFQD